MSVPSIRLVELSAPAAAQDEQWPVLLLGPALGAGTELAEGAFTLALAREPDARARGLPVLGLVSESGPEQGPGADRRRAAQRGGAGQQHDLGEDDRAVGRRDQVGG